MRTPHVLIFAGIFSLILSMISSCGNPSGNKPGSAGNGIFKLETLVKHGGPKNPRDKSQEMRPDAGSRIFIVKKTNIIQILEENGEIVPLTSADITSRISGRVIRLLSDEGRTVRKGTILATVEPDVTQARSLTTLVNSLADAKLDYLKALSDYTQQKALFEKGYISKNNMDDAENAFQKKERDYKSRQQEYETARKDLGVDSIKVERLPIVSPLDGIVLNRYVEEGELISGDSSVRDGTKLFTVADTSKLAVKIEINEADIYKLEEGQNVNIRVTANPSEKYTGTIYRISPYAENVNGIKVFKTEVRFDRQDTKLRPGMTASISMKMKAKDGVLAVPITAVFVDDKQEYVFVPAPGGKADKRPVKHGLNDENNVEILEGLEPGMKVFADIPYKELSVKDTFVPSSGKK